MISLMAKSDLRSEVLGNHDGTYSLKINDLPNIVIHQGIVKCIRVSNKITVRREISKTRKSYFTFSSATVTIYILVYLNDRFTHVEPSHRNSPVIDPDYRYNTNRKGNKTKLFLPTRQISKRIRDTFRPRFSCKPYVLSAYLDTQLLITESKGKIANDIRVFSLDIVKILRQGIRQTKEYF